jgi:SAM-dependent methyltransferase
MPVPRGEYVRFFPPDSRSSDEKLRIIEEHGAARVAEMETEEFRRFDYDYWDRPEALAGYAGYRYDGRYADVAKKMAAHYGLEPGQRLLEVGCGKGHLLVEFHYLGLDVAGVDLSEYASENAHPDIRERVLQGSILAAPFADGSFDLVLAKDTLPHLSEEELPAAVEACSRLSRRACFLEIEVARNDYEAEMLYRWDLTHQTRRPPEWWLDLFDRTGYTGDYHFKVLVEDPELGPID